MNALIELISNISEFTGSTGTIVLPISFFSLISVSYYATWVFLGVRIPRRTLTKILEGMLFNLQDFEQNEIPVKQRSFEDSINTFLRLFHADLLLIWMKNFWHGFLFHSTSCPVLHIMLIISRGECRIW